MIYLDYSATTPVDKLQVNSLIELFSESFGNPSSMHKMGIQNEKKIKKSRAQVANALNAMDKEIIFTSGGTEANNLAIKGTVERHSRGKIITTSFEHPSVLNCVEQLGEKGYEVVFLPVDKAGQISIEKLALELTADTLIVSIMHVNNEIGSIQPIVEIGNFIKSFNEKNNKKVVFHVDAVQSFGKIELDVKKANADLITLSAHKIGGLKGVGALFIRDGLALKPLFYGGNQERSIRPGTENIYGIVSMGMAAEQAIKEREPSYNHVKELKYKMIDILNEKCDRTEINGSCDYSSPYILNLSFRGVKGEILLHTLEMNDIYVSTGSACSSKKKNYSHVLKAMKLDDERMDGAIRISFSKETTAEDVEKATLIICKEVEALRKIIKRR